MVQGATMRRRVSNTATIDLRDVRAFCAVVDAGSVTAASKLLTETKGSVSRRIARLEKALGVALLRRSPRLVQPTEHGLLYRKKVGRALELFDHAADTIEGEKERPSGRLRVTAPSDFALGFLPELSVRFVERYPEVQFEMVATDNRLDFDAQRLDCALRVGNLRDSNLKVQKLVDLELAFYASPTYLAKAGVPQRPADLARMRHIAYANLPPPFEVPFERGGHRTVITLEPAIRGDGAFVHSVIAAGGGFGGIPRLLAQRALDAGQIVELLPQYRLSLTRPLSLLYPAGAFVPAKVRAFRDFLLETCQFRGKVSI